MIRSTTTCMMVKDYDYKTAVKMIKEAGFDAYDLSLTDIVKPDDTFFGGEDYLENAKQLRAFADSIGIPCNQAHAPFPSSFSDEERTEERFRQIVKAMEIAAVCGAKIIVVHPIQHLAYRTNRETLRELNRNFYLSLKPYCEKFGIKVALENMWQYEPYEKKGKKTLIVESTCATAQEFCEYLDSLPREHFVACLDIGHVVLVHEDITRMITALGHERLKALHVHDNWLNSDAHSVPMLGEIPYDEVIDALRAVNYDGDLTLETIGFEGPFPFELKPAVLRFLSDVAKLLVKRIEE